MSDTPLSLDHAIRFWEAEILLGCSWKSFQKIKATGRLTIHQTRMGIMLDRREVEALAAERRSA